MHTFRSSGQIRFHYSSDLSGELTVGDGTGNTVELSLGDITEFFQHIKDDLEHDPEVQNELEQLGRMLLSREGQNGGDQCQCE